MKHYTNPRRRAVSHRRPMSPAMRKRSKQLALAEALEYIDMARDAKRKGNNYMAGLLADAIESRLAFVEGRKPVRRSGRMRTNDGALTGMERRLRLAQAAEEN